MNFEQAHVINDFRSAIEYRLSHTVRAVRELQAIHESSRSLAPVLAMGMTQCRSSAHETPVCDNKKSEGEIRFPAISRISG
ncbi:MAG: hypothetical protein WA826_08305 [Silvibacterium sp.]